jgi:hypothetical protein
VIFAGVPVGGTFYANINSRVLKLQKSHGLNGREWVPELNEDAEEIGGTFTGDFHPFGDLEYVSSSIDGARSAGDWRRDERAYA